MGIMKRGQNLYRIDSHVRRNGKEFRRRELLSGTKAQAEDRYLQIKKELREGGNARSLTLPDLRTFGDLLKIFKEKREQCSTSHMNKILLLERELGSVALSVFPERFEAYLRIIKTATTLYPKKPRTKPRSNTCINRLLEVVRAAFNMGVSLGILKVNPITKVRYPRLKELPRDVVLSDIDRQRLQNVVEKEAPHLSAALRFALQVPCRKSELVNMKKEDLDLIHNTIRVKAGNSKNDIGCYKPIPPDMVDYFRNLPSETEYLFYRKEEDEKTGNVSYFGLGSFHSAWSRCLRLAKLQGFHFHDTRHMAATMLVDNGTPEQAVMTVANWKTNMLRNYYHREPRKMLELVQFSPKQGHFWDTPKAEAL